MITYSGVQHFKAVSTRLEAKPHVTFHASNERTWYNFFSSTKQPQRSGRVRQRAVTVLTDEREPPDYALLYWLPQYLHGGG